MTDVVIRSGCRIQHLQMEVIFQRCSAPGCHVPRHSIPDIVNIPIGQVHGLDRNRGPDPDFVDAGQILVRIPGDYCHIISGIQADSLLMVMGLEPVCAGSGSGKIQQLGTHVGIIQFDVQRIHVRQHRKIHIGHIRHIKDVHVHFIRIAHQTPDRRAVQRQRIGVQIGAVIAGFRVVGRLKGHLQAVEPGLLILGKNIYIIVTRFQPCAGKLELGISGRSSRKGYAQGPDFPAVHLIRTNQEYIGFHLSGYVGPDVHFQEARLGQ